MRAPIAGRNSPAAFLSFGFRPFFLAAALTAPLLMVPWLLFLLGLHQPLPWANPLEWHVHEMIFGFVGAALAGFLLTAVANWTGRPPVQGAMLGTLLAAWLAGRVAMTGITGLPATGVAVVDLLFPFFLLALVAREILLGGNRRNLALVAIVGFLALSNVAFHLGAGGRALDFSLHVLLLLVVVVGGRVIPAFTGNWLRGQGAAEGPVSRPTVERLVVSGGIVIAVADTFASGSVLIGALAAILAGLHGYRLAGWRGRATWREPLVAVLHVAYAWLVAGYGLLAVSAFTDLIPRSAGLHALAAGGIGTMILAIMTRASLGHTGRPLHATAAAVGAYLLVGAGALLRVLAPLLPALYGGLIVAAGVLWALGFAVFAIVYFPILTGPRLDR